LFCLERRKGKTPEGETLATDWLVPAWAHDDLTAAHPCAEQPCLHRVLAECPHDQVVHLASLYGLLTASGKVLPPEPVETWHREIRNRHSRWPLIDHHRELRPDSRERRADASLDSARPQGEKWLWRKKLGGQRLKASLNKRRPGWTAAWPLQWSHAGFSFRDCRGSRGHRCTGKIAINCTKSGSIAPHYHNRVRSR
jgi:hypothetical protein